MKAMQLYRHLVSAGWEPGKKTILAARFYVGLESEGTLLWYLHPGEVAEIIYSR